MLKPHSTSIQDIKVSERTISEVVHTKILMSVHTVKLIENTIEPQ